MNENPQSNYAWEDRLTWFKSSSEYKALDTIDGEPMEFECNIFPGFTTLQLLHKVQELVSIYARRFSPGFLGPGSVKKWYSTREYKPLGEWDRVAEQMMINFAESGHPVFRATSPLSRGNAQKQRW